MYVIKGFFSMLKIDKSKPVCCNVILFVERREFRVLIAYRSTFCSLETKESVLYETIMFNEKNVIYSINILFKLFVLHNTMYKMGGTQKQKPITMCQLIYNHERHTSHMHY